MTRERLTRPNVLSTFTDMHTDTAPELVPIGEAARILGVSVDTLRRWEKDGVLIPVRTLKGHRRYSRADLTERMTERAS